MGNPEKLTTQDPQGEDKESKYTTQKSVNGISKLTTNKQTRVCWVCNYSKDEDKSQLMLLHLIEYQLIIINSSYLFYFCHISMN